MERSFKRDKNKTSRRLCNRVIVRQWSKNKSHHHVKESRTFCKARVCGVLLPTPCGRCLTKMRQKLVSRHSPKTITARVVKICYPRNMQYLGYKIRGNYNMCTSKCHGKPRYRGIDTVFIGVKLLYKHDGTSQGSLIKRFLALSRNDRRERNVGKV